jgi:hypothetical protein
MCDVGAGPSFYLFISFFQHWTTVMIRVENYGSGRGIYNPREIIDGGHIYNVPKIIDSK